MHAGVLLAAAAALNISAFSDHGPKFDPYTPPLPAFSGGEGGKQTSVLGVEVWSQGAPDRPFQILGILTDNRVIGPYDGPSRSGFVEIIARGARAAGGDAAVLDSAVPDNQRSYATVASGNMREFLNGGRPHEGSYVTRFWVVKYLAAAAAIAEPSAP